MVRRRHPKKTYAKRHRTAATVPPATPQEVDRADEEARILGLTRRAFIRISLVGTGFVGFIASVTQIADYFGLRPTIETDEALLRSLFGLHTGHSAALIPAADHPWKRPPTGHRWYPQDAAGAAAYKERFFAALQLRTVAGLPNARREDNILLFGSQVSNRNTRLVLGNPWNPKAQLEATCEGWRAELMWNLHSPPDAAITERIQFGNLWHTAKHRIVTRDSGNVYEARAGIGWMADDYLLVTALPRYAQGDQRILVFSGIHAPGSQATSLLFAAPPIEELRRMRKLTSGEPFYQALFHVEVSQNESGEYEPRKLALVDARSINVVFRAV